MPSDPETKPLALTSYVTIHLARTQNKLNAQASHILKTHSDLSLVEWRIIQLLRHFDSASISKLAREVDMDKGQVSRKVSAMVAKDLVVSLPDKNDHRRQHLHLTQGAVEIAKRVTPIMERRQALLAKGVLDADMQTFLDVLAKINAAAENRDFEKEGEQ
jgi:DNA-binding MarR family transcriptional regulator